MIRDINEKIKNNNRSNIIKSKVHDKESYAIPEDYLPELLLVLQRCTASIP
jgi:hypothetical protein